MLQNFYNLSQNLRLKMTKKYDLSLAKELLEKHFNIKLYNSQIVAAKSLVDGNITEIETGQGKTYIACLSAITIAKNGQKVFVATSNEYLAERDCISLKDIYKQAGLVSNFITSKTTDSQKKEIYENSDIIYGTLTEFGFDILRSGIRINNEQKSLTIDILEKSFLIIDEIDYTILDEATTPLIISEPNNASVEKFKSYYKIALNLFENNFYTIDLKSQRVELNDDAYDYIEKQIELKNISNGNPYDDGNIIIYHYIESALSSIITYKNGVDYIVKNNQITLIDSNSGRIGEGRQLGEGLHQFLQLKESIKITPENKIKAKLTYTSLIKLFNNFSGMSGTIYSEKEEIELIYGKRTLVVTPDIKSKKKIHNDYLFKDKELMFSYAIEKTKELSINKRPVLLIVRTVEDSIRLSNLLFINQIQHNLLNAESESSENEIINKSGCLSAVTISTAIAGRGTDIKIGKNKEESDIIEKSGGLAVIVCERNLSRRIDNQIAGRTGRNGKRGDVYFLSSMENDLFRMLPLDKRNSIINLFAKTDMVNGKAITSTIESIQKGLQFKQFELRKKEALYDSELLKSYILFLHHREGILNECVDNSGKISKECTFDYIKERILLSYNSIISVDSDNVNWVEYAKMFNISIDSNEKEKIFKTLKDRFDFYVDKIGHELTLNIIKGSDLNSIDMFWSDFLIISEIFKKHAELQAIAQKKPFYEFQKTILNLNQYFWEDIYEKELILNIFKINIKF